MIASLHRIKKEAGNAFLRFPFAVIFGAFCSLFLSYLLFVPYDQDALEEFLINLSLAAYIGMIGGVFFPLLGKSRLFPRGSTPFLQLLAPLAAILYYFFLPDLPHSAFPNSIVYGYLLWVLAFHFGVAFAPFIGDRDPEKFWQYNKALFLRILMGVLYAGVLFAGLSIAMFTFEHLFLVDLPEECYGVLWFVLAGVFNTWFFVAGIPKEPLDLDPEAPYPKGLKIFTQYVLLPLVSIYMGLLYLYLFKVLIQWELPKGTIAYLVLAFSVVGILAILLLYPIRHREGSRWVGIFSRWFYISLFPVIALLGVSIYLRVQQYGVTEERYFVIVLALWLAAIALFYSIKGNRNIRIIPLSLFLICVLISFGPWGAFEVSERDQRGRLRTQLASLGALNEKGKVEALPKKMPRDSVQEVENLVDYLLETHGAEGVNPLFEKDLDSLFREEALHDHQKMESRVMELMGKNEVAYESRGVYESRSNASEMRTGTLRLRQNERGIPVGPYERMFPFDANRSFAVDTMKWGFDPKDTGRIVLEGHVQRTSLELKQGDSLIARFDLEPLFERAMEESSDPYFTLSWPVERLMLKPERGADWGLFFHELQFRLQSSAATRWRILEMEGMLFQKGKGRPAP